MKKMIIISMVMAAMGFSVTSSAYAGWPIYSKPEFRGRVIDAETKEPIEGAVVVVLYYKRPLIGGPGGPNSYIFNAKEILTDNNGEFHFSSYSSLILFTEDAGTTFIFYKPGYLSSYGPTHIDVTLREKYFSTDVIGKVADIEEGSFEQGSYVKWNGPLGIMELKEAKTREEKLQTLPSPPTDYTSDDLPLFIKIINEEGKKRGLKGGYK
jgi:hypothetical protein